MASIEERLKNVRTMEDVVNLLTILFTNLNNQNEMYYNMFLNPTPMDIELERYDENGVLETVTLPNRAKDRIWIYTGIGNPNGVVAARVGSVYLDTEERVLYFKSAGEDKSNWIQMWSENNLNYLAPDGNGSQLTNLNASSIDMGTLRVERGGTGRDFLDFGKFLQGNGINPVDLIDVSSIASSLKELVGMIMYCPYTFEDESELGHWLICDGRAISRTDYADLFNKIGTKYGTGDGSSTFNIPNLIGRYIKGGKDNVGTLGDGHMPAHSHPLSGYSGYENGHVHGPGTLNATGYFSMETSGIQLDGKLFSRGALARNSKTSAPGGTNDRRINFNLANAWNTSTRTTPGTSHRHPLTGTTGTAGSDSSNEVNHMVLIPVIRY